jgi:hypothetical protein
MIPASTLAGEDKEGRLEGPTSVPSPSPSLPPTRADVGQQEPEHGDSVDEGAQADVEMGSADDVQGGDHGTEALDEKAHDTVGEELVSVPWSPLRRADKADVLPAVDIRVHDPDPELRMELE